MNELISIFIPTYNRAEVLSSVLDKVIAQIADYRIKIYIYDNGSTDNTKEIVNSKQKIYELIEYYCNKVNLGPDKNMLNILKFNETKYILMLGDDDYILESFYDTLNPYLTQDFGFIVLANEDDYQKESTKIFSNKDEAFPFLWDKMPYGSLIMHTGFIKEGEVDKYIGTSHAYSAICWEILAKNPKLKCLYLSQKLLVYLGKVQKTWNSSAMDIFYYQIPLWFSLLPDSYNSKEDVFIKSKKLRFKWKSLISCKIYYNFNVLSSKHYFTSSEKLKYELINILPINLLPIQKIWKVLKPYVKS